MNRNIFFSFLLLFAFFTASFAQSEPTPADFNESVKIETIKVPFGILLDKNLNRIRVKLSDGENIRLSAVKKDSNASLEIVAYKNGEVVEDKKVVNDFEGEFDFKDVDEIVLKSFGKFLIKATKLEIIADMEINIPKDTIISDENGDKILPENEEKNQDLNKSDTKIVEEVISAKDEEAFKKATGGVDLVGTDNNKTLITTDKENKIELSYDDTLQKREFDEKLKEEIEKEGRLKELPKKPSDLETKKEKIVEIEKEPKAIAPNLKELKEKEIKTSLKREIPKESLKPKGLDNHFPNLKDIENESKIKTVLKEDLKENRINIKKPEISKEILPKSFEDENLKDIAKRSDLKQIVSNDEIKKPSVEKIEKISKAFETTIYFKTPKIINKSLSINKPSIKNVNNINISNKSNFQSQKPKISSLDDSSLKAKKVESIKSINEKSQSLEIKTPNILSNEDISKKPSIEKTPSLVKSEINVGEKPNIKENISIKPPKISTKIEAPSIINTSILPSKKPDIESKESFNKPSSLPSNLTGYLDVYVLKDGKPTIGWISIIDERTNKVVANGDTFYKNPATFKLPVGKYTILIVDKKVVPPLEEKIYSVEVKGGERTVAKSTFASGTLKVAVLKNSIPTSTAYVKIYDAKTNEKIVDDNTYKNNPIVARLPFGDYYVVVEDYSITPKQHIVLKNIKIDGKKEILKSIDFEEGKLKILTLKNDTPIPAKYEIFLSGFSKKIKSGFTDPNSGEALIKLAAGNYDVRIIHRGSVSKTVKKFKNVSIEKGNVKELDVLFREGKLRVISKRGLNPLYTNVSIYKPGSSERLYFDFTSRENGEVVIDLPAGVYDVVVRDHNIKRVFKKVRIKEKKVYTIHAKF